MSNQTGDPKLGTLADNGGPTPTMALGADSNAIDAGAAVGNDPAGNPVPNVDQRGVDRPQGAHWTSAPSS